MSEFDALFYNTGIEKLVSRLDKYLNQYGDYVKKYFNLHE